MSNVKIYYDRDADTAVLNDKVIAVIGYGTQGCAQARMLHESGMQVIVGCRLDGPSSAQAKADGLTVYSISEAAQKADIVHVLLPDEVQQEIYETEIAPQLNPGNILSFSHGFNITYKLITPPPEVGVIMVAPKAPGTKEYEQYQQGFGVPALLAVAQESADKNAKEIALAMAKAMHFTKAGVLECTFAEETYEDLFGEQAVLCGGLTELIKAGYEVLTEAGYPGELAYFECLHEMKLIVDLLYEGGMPKMWETVSNTAEYGGHTRGNRIITPAVKAEMKKILAEVENGSFARQWIKECRESKMQNLLKMRQAEAEHDVEKTGSRIRKMFATDS